MIEFNNTYINLPQEFYDINKPAQFTEPELIVFNESLAKDLGINFKESSPEQLARIFSGQDILSGSEPLSMAYGGFQFGHPAPVLGDGRAHLLGEVNGFDIQLKGSGQSKFSRRGDGRSALGPVIREYIVSEFMNKLGVPTTRALCAVRTKEDVYRNAVEPAGIFTRVASSHIRVGTFQYFMFKKDIKNLEVLLRYTVKRHFPDLSEYESDLKKLAIEFLKKLGTEQAKLVAKWYGLGFIHGVMNTDNFSAAGITIDYGPCAFMEEFKRYKVFSYIDREGRYSFWNQVPIAQWNMLRLADCLLPLIDKDIERAAKFVESEIVETMEHFPKERSLELARKLGITDYKKEDDLLIDKFLDYMEEHELDFTLSFRNLSKLYSGESSFYPNSSSKDSFVESWTNRLGEDFDASSLNKINPIYIPRNHQVRRIIEHSYERDYTPLVEILNVMKDPYNEQPGFEQYETPALIDDRVHTTFCGT